MTEQPSSSDFIQASRVLKVKSPLGEDQLLPERMVITEGVSQLFEIQLNVRAKKEAVKPEELIGRLVDVSIEVQQGDGEEGSGIRRPFNGLVTDLHEGPPITRGLRSYAMTIRPQMWLLSRRSDCRIWMDKTSVDIVETLFSEHGIPAPDTSGIIKVPPTQHYSVQFNETDLDYLLRRFEEDGLFYWFSHEDGSHKLHVADTANGWLGPSPSAQGEGKVRLAQGSSDRNHINDWARRFSYVSGQRAGADWNFETPGMVPGNMTPSLVQMPDATKRELYEYPARIKTVEEAERAQKLRAQSIEADHDRVFGGSTSRILEAGRRFTPYEVAHPEHEYEEHVVIKASHTIVDRSYETNSNEPEYRNTFEAIPARVPLTPHRTTKRPKIEGTQVAIVAGPEGEEVHPDQYGRIKLWFPWDRKAKKDGTDTCWVRVAQNWAGSTWGGQIIPRIGMEVMVAFVDGDPDRPLVTGVVPNARQTVPYELPANKTRSVFRTKTHKGIGNNELRFEDQSGSEEVFVHAQRDHSRIVNRDDSHIVRRNRFDKVFGDVMHAVNGSRRTQVGGAAEDVILGNLSISVGQRGRNGSMIEAGRFGDHSHISGKPNLFDSFKHSMRPGLGAGGTGSFQISTEGAFILNASKDVDIKTQSGFDLNTKTDCDISSQAHVHVDAAQSISLTSGDVLAIHGKRQIVLSCGKAKIVLTNDGRIILDGVSISTLASGDNVIVGKKVIIN